MTKVLLAFISLSLISCQNKSQPGSRTEFLPYYKEATFTPNWYHPDSVPADFHKIPSFSLINQNGKRLTEKDFKGKIYVADFFFTTCPGICPKMTANMGLVQESFKNDPEILLLSHSVTPELDSVPVLKEYAAEKGVLDDKWHLVTGERDLIYTLGRYYYFVEEDLGLLRENDDFLHTENFVLIDRNRYIRGIYNGLNKTSVNQLIADIKTLK